MATFGDCEERAQTDVPMNMCHVYIHEIPVGETVIGIVQSDGVANMRTLEACGRSAWSSPNAEHYLKGIQGARDDMSAAMAIYSPNEASMSSDVRHD